MKRLNRKGFTLVELLAVIVILAIVVGITMATILPTLENARERSFTVALDTVEKYLQDQLELEVLGPTAQGTGSNYVSQIGKNYSKCTSTALCGKTIDYGTDAVDILALTEYTSNIEEIGWYVENGDVKIACATITSTGDYSQGSITVCDTSKLKNPVTAPAAEETPAE